MDQIEIHSVTEYISAISELGPGIYRGQVDAWPLLPSISRDHLASARKRNPLLEKNLLERFRLNSVGYLLTLEDTSGAEVIPIIESNTFRDVHLNNQNDKISKLLQHYKITRDDVKKANNEYNVIKNKFNSNIGIAPLIVNNTTK